jgi:predicted secreted protein
MARINGTDLILTVATNAVAHTTSASLNIEMATIDVSSKDDSGNQNVIGGQKSSTIDFEGLTDFASSGYGIDDLFDLLDNRTEVAWILGVSGGANFTGSGFITSLTLDAPMEDASTYSGSITVTDGVTYSAS